jgi:recombination protein RecA
MNVYTNGKTNPALRELDYTLASLERRFGENSVMRLGQAHHLHAQAIPTGFMRLDKALGVGGLPRGRIAHIYGPEFSGKTTLCLATIAQAQRAGGLGCFIDMEHAIDPGHAANCGIEAEALYLAQPTCGEEALEIAETMVKAGVSVVAIDSTAALVPRAELAVDMGDNVDSLHGRLMSQAMRKLAGIARKNNTLLIFTSQMRTRPGVTVDNHPTGGKALRFYSSVAIDLQPLRWIKAGGQVVGRRIKATVKKNKVARPYQTAEIDLNWGK